MWQIHVQTEFSSVSIRPEAEGVRFYPAEYFIGPMNPDELFTIGFNTVPGSLSDAKRDTSEPINMTLSTSYGNGINKHKNIVSSIYIQPFERTQEGSSRRKFKHGGSRLNTCYHCWCRYANLQKEETE